MDTQRRDILKKGGGVTLLTLVAAAGWLPREAAAQAGVEQGRVRHQDDGRDDEGARRRRAGAEQGHHVRATPDIAENGAVVPVGVTSTIPKTESIAILVEKNPNMLVASFDIPAGTEPGDHARA